VSGFLGIAACVEFWGASLVFGALRPSYSHSVNTISEGGRRVAIVSGEWWAFAALIEGVLTAAFYWVANRSASNADSKAA
jgi:hypothetical protein